MKKLLFLILFWCSCALGAEQITMFVTVTNPAVTGNEITVNGTTRIWTNSYSAGTIQTNSLAGPAATATNLSFSYSGYVHADKPWVYQTSTNIVRLIFPVGITVSGSQVGNWCSFSYSTQIVTRSWALRVPMSIEAATNQTNFASMLVDGLAKATNRFEPAWEAFTNFGAIGRHNIWTGTNRFQNGWWTNLTLINLASASGILGALTNGVLTNTILVWPVMTNASSYGGFRSPGAGALSEQYGSGAASSGDNSVAIGYGATASGLNSLALGQGALASGVSDLAVGPGTEAAYGASVTVGSGSQANATNSVALGANATVATGHAGSMALGNGVTTTETNQVMLGLSTAKVRIPGRLEVTGTITNAVLTGTNSVGVSGGPYSFLAIRRRNITTLANGNNAGINPGGATYIKVSGPTALFTINGITNGMDGYLLVIENNTGYAMNIANDSGVDPVPGNRIYTLSGSDLTLDGNSTVTLIYDSDLSRWIVCGGSHADLAESYAELYTHDNAGTMTITASNTYYLVTNFNTAGHSSVMTVSAASNQIYSTIAGTYLVGVSGSYGGTASKTITVAVFTNGVVCNNIHGERKLDAAGDIGNLVAAGLINIPAGIAIDVRAKANDNSVAFSLKQGNFRLHKVQ